MNNEHCAAVTGLGPKTLDVSFSPRSRQYTPKMDSTRIKIIIYEPGYRYSSARAETVFTYYCMKFKLQ